MGFFPFYFPPKVLFSKWATKAGLVSHPSVECGPRESCIATECGNGLGDMELGPAAGGDLPCCASPSRLQLEAGSSVWAGTGSGPSKASLRDVALES